MKTKFILMSDCRHVKCRNTFTDVIYEMPCYILYISVFYYISK